MNKVYRIILVLICLLVPNNMILKAQDDILMVRLRAGNNTSFGNFAAVSFESAKRIYNELSVSGGVQYNTIGKTALEARPAYDFPFDWGVVSAEMPLTYTNFSSVNSFTAGAGASFKSVWASARLGWYYRVYGGKGGKINEPFNVYYEATVHFLRNIKDWNLDFTITDCEIFELERHYQPSFIIEGSYYPTENLGVHLGIGCNPAGMFNIAADYYQTYLRTGVCYRW